MHRTYVVVSVLVDLLAAVDDSALARCLDLGVVCMAERSELRLVLVRRDVILANVRHGDRLLVLDLGGVLGVENRLSVVLHVVYWELQERQTSQSSVT